MTDPGDGSGDLVAVTQRHGRQRSLHQRIWLDQHREAHQQQQQRQNRAVQQIARRADRAQQGVRNRAQQTLQLLGQIRHLQRIRQVLKNRIGRARVHQPLLHGFRRRGDGRDQPGQLRDHRWHERPDQSDNAAQHHEQNQRRANRPWKLEADVEPIDRRVHARGDDDRQRDQQQRRRERVERPPQQHQRERKRHGRKQIDESGRAAVHSRIVLEERAKVR